ncbi:MAG: hypothetical protein CMK64_02455 [Pseudoalteromonas sp.]|uniref:hypothetical protein n=1 Tax=Pseudoalteromonas phenolica TaxID=161398 RepID=UPI000C09EC99|nr:hypothetical protein [Pseudoalteromonas sp.]|tara:strand:+ start:6141 stop:6566 length:426 start_codon:yes stop_codon:yes gene_type:complete
MKFKAHGLWRVHIEHSTIYIALKGGFNREGVIDFQNDMIKRVMSELTPCDSAVLNLSEFEMSTSDSLEATKEYFEGVKQRGYKWVDYIGVNPIAEHLLRQLWQGAKTEICFYPNEKAYISAKPEHIKPLTELSQISFEHPH